MKITNTTAAEIAATIDTILERERRRAPLDHRDWSDKTADQIGRAHV